MTDTLEMFRHLLGDPGMALIALLCALCIFVAGALAGLAARKQPDDDVRSDAGDTQINWGLNWSALERAHRAGLEPRTPWPREVHLSSSTRPRVRAIGGAALKPSYDARTRVAPEQPTRNASPS